ncbi:MAG: hypothetical protein H7257_03695 [Taibaiella sp.]|nr:hypothetical protein [Taibaiella sp.]
MQFRDIASGTKKVYHFAVSIAPLLISIAFVVAGIIIRDVPVTLFLGCCAIVLGWAQFVGFSGAKSDCDDSDLSYYSAGEFSYTETGFQYEGKEQELLLLRSIFDFV